MVAGLFDELQYNIGYWLNKKTTYISPATHGNLLNKGTIIEH